MAKTKFYTTYHLPPKCHSMLDYETNFVSQSECETGSLQYQLHRFGMDSVLARMEDLKSKFGYADCTKISSFAKAQNDYVKGKEYFEALPSEVRRQYHDTPEEFFEDVAKNPDTAYKAGFISEDYYKSVKAMDVADKDSQSSPEIVNKSDIVGENVAGQPNESLD